MVRMYVGLTTGIALASAALAPSAAFAGAALPDPELCKISQGQINMVENGQLDQALFVGASSNTDKGKGNGGELAIFGIICFSGLDGETEVNIDANDLDGIIATDPGNSNQTAP
jgi:hypothetical protein